MTQKPYTTAHVYTVELRFSGDQLESFEISARLHLKPSHAFSQSQSQLASRKRVPYWAYNGKEEIGFQTEWASLQEGLEFLLKVLNSKKSEIIALGRQYEGVWWCGHFQASFDGGPTLSAKLLTELGSYALPLTIDNYFGDA